MELNRTGLRSLLRAGEPGLYLLTDPPDVDVVRWIAGERGLAVFRVRCAGAAAKQAFLDRSAEAVGFPSYFGSNWDAFEECVTDLSWVQALGFVVLLEGLQRFASEQPCQWGVAKNILASAVEHWEKRGVPMYVLVDATTRTHD